MPIDGSSMFPSRCSSYRRVEKVEVYFQCDALPRRYPPKLLIGSPVSPTMRVSVLKYAILGQLGRKLRGLVDSFLSRPTFVEKWKWAVTAGGRMRNRLTEKRLCRIGGIEPDAISREVLAHCRRRLVAAACASSLASRYVAVSRVYVKLMAAARGKDVNVARELECWEAISRRFDKVDRLRAHIAALRAQPKIVMSTIHGAKGGEWNHVIVLNVTEGALPLHHAIRTNTIHEEQRLFYVAVTLARERLYLFHAPYRHAWSGKVFAKPSRFLTESVLATLSGHRSA
jgi:DNA helicase-2/ATP-dependent DNA helicase PcrA